ncbi:TIGR02186 family protein [Ancylobacter terrae]|uniref:TIGR02186 family protein n=1 Tax=Ancylobacter sp. sgz301288 TaxID=3342077 RepID=UPI0038581CE7
MIARLVLLAGLAAAAVGALPARADDLVLSLSKQRVTITSSFTGDDLVLFGVVPGDLVPADAPLDAVVTVRGPGRDFVTRRKEPRFGLWMNVDSRAFLGAPAYLAVLSNRPVSEIADAETRRQEQLGLADNRFLQRIGTDFADVVPHDPFRQAFLRVKEAQGLYYERTAGVAFIAPHVFRAAIPIPGTAPVGTYEVSVKLFQNKEMIGRGFASFTVGKTDFEETVAVAARDHSVFYGLATALGALLIGFIGNIAFRRD